MTAGAEAAGQPRLTLLTRAGCDLCDEMQEALSQLSLELPLPHLVVQEVDADPLLARRYALDLPVLLLDGVMVCKHRLDKVELRRLLRQRQ
ncbi:MAG TPA: glutaredoxin family protein [Steroidobacteraceae bacterium]|nr:glutaredoxin family protein [Steroidobacteraceae bacterium]